MRKKNQFRKKYKCKCDYVPLTKLTKQIPPLVVRMFKRLECRSHVTFTALFIEVYPSHRPAGWLVSKSYVNSYAVKETHIQKVAKHLIKSVFLVCCSKDLPHTPKVARFSSEAEFFNVQPNLNLHFKNPWQKTQPQDINMFVFFFAVKRNRMRRWEALK